MWMLLGYNQADSILNNYAQTRENLAKNTRYQLTDTINFPAIYPGLDTCFSVSLQEELKQQEYSNLKTERTLKERIRKHGGTNESRGGGEPLREYLSSDTVIVVKKLWSNKHALALYRDWKLFIATHVSPWWETPNGIFLSGLNWESQTRLDFRKSAKHDDAPMSFAFHISWGVFGHTGYVNGNKISHGCIRIPGGYAMIIQSVVAGKIIPVYISL